MSGLDQFIEEVGLGLGDSRRVSRATEYVRALLAESSEPKSFAQLARLMAGDEEDRYRREQSFQHLVNGSSWDPDDLLRPVAERMAEEIDVTALMLLAVVFPRLGEHQPQYPDNRSGRQQVASVLQLVGRDRRGEPAILPIRWRLSLEGSRWQDPRERKRAEVDYAVGVHISVHGSRHLAATRGWRLPREAPLVAGPSYGWLRTRWLRSAAGGGGPSYVVELPEAAAWGSKQDLEMLVATRPDDLVLDGPTAIATTAGSAAGGEERRSEVWSFYELAGDLGREHVVVSTPFDAREPALSRAWCTNLPAADEAVRQRLVDLARLRRSGQAFWDELRYGVLGAANYRGLSVKGWERHCALVSAAQAFRIHAGLREPRPPAVPAGSPGASPRDWREQMAALQVGEDPSRAACRWNPNLTSTSAKPGTG